MTHEGNLMTLCNYICIETIRQFNGVLELYLYWNCICIGIVSVLKLYLYLKIP